AVGIDDVRAQLLPADKLTAIQTLKKEYAAVAFIGDGVNDAPALAAAHLGIAFGASASDTALETADVVVLKPELSRLASLLAVGQRCRSRLHENVALAILTKVVTLVLAPHRRTVVINNLLAPLSNDAAAAHKNARNLFQQFALKLVDLWRYEAGLNIDDLFGPTSGWEHFLEAQAQKRGILLVTPHLGNWEFGGPLLRQRGVRLQVLTLAEPGADFTRLRQGSRARWDIETLVIGDDPFAFLDVIRRLEDGATVALLLDRPPAPSAVTVQLFGRPFAASVAVAELARASGCILLPVYLPRVNGRYEAHILPPVPYERATLRDRAARQQLTQTLISVFEPLIRQYPDQWYHFIPVWPLDSGTQGTTNGGQPEEASS
ncbi:MAG: HAD-IC family P-type ATPase, partial [Limisphaerales bacterium]